MDVLIRQGKAPLGAIRPLDIHVKVSLSSMLMMRYGRMLGLMRKVMGSTIVASDEGIRLGITKLLD